MPLLPRITRHCWLCLGASLWLPTLALADTTAEILAQKGVISLEEYEKIRAAERNQALVDTSEGLKFVSPDKRFSAQLGTLLQLDMAGYHSDIRDASGRDLSNAGSEFRRIRLSLGGTFDGVWDYKTELEFANSTQLMDGYVSYRGFNTPLPLQLTLGHAKIPFGQESLSADKGLTFMERSLASAFLNPRAPGAMLSSGRDHWSAAAMVFGEQLSSSAAAISDEGGGASLRLTWAPWIGPGANLHLGAAAGLRLPSQNSTSLGGTPGAYTEAVRFQSKPESNIITTRLVDTGTITQVDDTRLWGLELGGSRGAWGFNSEYIHTRVNRHSGLDSLDFSGWYAQTTAGR